MPLEPKRPIRPTPPSPPSRSDGRPDRDAKLPVKKTVESPSVPPPLRRITPPANTPSVVAKPSPALEEIPADVLNHPIPPPSEELQYRAIGLIEGQYQPSEEQFTRGILRTAEGTELDAVLLGRVMNLVRKYLKTEGSYLWVVYPRTRQGSETLHVQIMGVWAPEIMGKPALAESAPPLIPDYFSIRGEVVFQSQEREVIIIKIRQAKKSLKGKDTSFKLRLIGTLPSKGVGYFWDLNVQRQGPDLAIQTATVVANVQKPQRRKKPGRPTKPGSAPSTTEKPQLVHRDANPKDSPHKQRKGGGSWSKPIPKRSHQPDA